MSGESAHGDQLALMSRARVRRRPGPPPAGTPAGVDPVASVLVDTGLAHLDRPFDYLVPADLDAQVRPGVRVKVRFAGRDLDGFVVERRDRAEFEGRLTPIRRVVSPEPVLTPPVLALAQEVARRSAGTVGDVLRLAIPARHAGAEQALPDVVTAAPPSTWAGWSPVSAAGAGDASAGTPPQAGGMPPWAAYEGGLAFLGRLADGGSPAAHLLALPATDPAQQWPGLLVEAAAATLNSGRGVILVVPDAGDLARVEGEIVGRWGRGHHVRLSADQGPQARYTAWLKVRRGHVPLVIGTRAAAYAPVRDLGLIAWWDDGDDSLAEPRAPYAHVHTVARVRADLDGAGVLAAGYVGSAVVGSWVREGFLKQIAAPRPTVRARTARVRVAGEEEAGARDATAGRARLPTIAWETARTGLETGAVLVQVPRRGYIPAVSCFTCRRRVQCTTCAGPVALPGPHERPQCRWCGRLLGAFTCPACGSTRLRSSIVGAARTAEELGRAFPGVPVHTSGGADVLGEVPGTPRLVIATPGAEPVADGGYAAALLLDAWALLDRPDLDAGIESLRRWCAAAALVRPRRDGGVVVVSGAPTHVLLPAVEALVRWDPAWLIDRELTDRHTVGLPPAARVGLVSGRHDDLVAATADVVWPAGATVLGPLPLGPPSGGAAGGERLIVSVPPESAADLARTLRDVRARWSAGRRGEALRVRMDPPDPAG